MHGREQAGAFFIYTYIVNVKPGVGDKQASNGIHRFACLSVLLLCREYAVVCVLLFETTNCLQDGKETG